MEQGAVKKRVAVIGAGLTGIGCLAELLQAGHDVRLYERNDDIGGVWHPSNCYSGLSLHGASAAFEYHDFPLPDLIDKARPISSAQVFDYLQAYFRHRDFYRYCEFESAVEKVCYSHATRTYTLHVRKTGSDDIQTADFDYVVYTHGFVSRTLPRIEGADRFAGQLFHSFDVTEAKLDEIVRSNRKVVVVGGSKSATDLILRFHHHGYQVKWLYRKNYWFLRSDSLIRITTQLAAGRSAGLFHRTAMFVGDFLGTKLPRVHLALWRASGLVHTFGARHWDFTKYHRGRIEAGPMSTLRTYSDTHGVLGEIAGFSADGLTLQDGRALQCDTVIFCTGSSAHTSLVAVETDGKPFDLASVRQVYRARVIFQRSRG